MGTMLVLTPALRMVGAVVVRWAASVVGSAAMISSTSHPKNHRFAMPICRWTEWILHQFTV